MDYIKLSKEISYALRHAPWEYELELDDEGWVGIAQLLTSLHESVIWQGLSEDDLYAMADKFDKKRFEISNGRIRALYGHSVPQKIIKVPDVPPEILYHGTARRFVQPISEQGLLPRNRQYVHLSADVETAMQVGKRRDESPVLLKIKALEAYSEGIKFYRGNEKVWLADSIPARYIMF